jgi:hypothetical protein
MERKKNQVAKLVKNSSESFGPSPLTSGVTKENYVVKCHAFMKWNGNVGFLIALKDGSNQGIGYRLSPEQWGAWRMYFTDRGISVKFMDVQGKAGKCFTVPAEWPHKFDSDAMIQRDHEVGNWFMNNYRAENVEYADAASRLSTVAAARSRFPRPPKAEKTPKSHLGSQASSINIEALLASHEIGTARHPRSKPSPDDFEF